jgi:hypothetical protein
MSEAGKEGRTYRLLTKHDSAVSSTVLGEVEGSKVVDLGEEKCQSQFLMRGGRSFRTVGFDHMAKSYFDQRYLTWFSAWVKSEKSNQHSNR